jgi:hypothetical protein
MWIILTKRVPTEVPVPKLSVHWSVPWPREWENAERKQEKLSVGQWVRRGYNKLGFDYAEHDGIPPDLQDTPFNPMFGYEPDWKNARKIRLKGEDVRVFPHEFAPISTESMRLLIAERVLVLHRQTDVAGEQVIEAELVGEQKVIYEEALVAGCDHAQAMMVAFGVDPTIPDAEFPPIGWYQCAPEYAAYFCRDWEMDEETEEFVQSARTKKRKSRRKAAAK